MNKSVIALSLMCSSLCFAQSVEEKGLRAKAEMMVKLGMQGLNATCKTTIPAEGAIDWASWKEAKGVGLYCKPAASSVAVLCEGSNGKFGKEAVTDKIKKFQCLGDATKGEATFELKDGTLILHTSSEAKFNPQAIQTWLKKNI